MLAPTEGSTNDSDIINLDKTNDKAPLILPRRFWHGLAGLCGFKRNTGMSSENGYVEFGGLGETPSGRTLGTFAGVFSPVALSMFSALLFLRVGFLVGNAGLLVTLFQFAIAYGILLFTVASICAISTNGAVEGGGAYFMISRTLGPEFGGSIGTLFFLANVVSSALYIVGCAEGLVENFGPAGILVEGTGPLPDGHWWRFLYCSVLNVLNLLVCLIGAGLFAKTNVIILATVCISLASTFYSFIVQPAREIPIPEANHIVQNSTNLVNGSFTGLSAETLHSNLYPDYGKDYTSDSKHPADVFFSTVFGVLFSGVTGIMAGANMSGELKDPAKNIPRGTLSAVLFTMVCYVVVALLTAASCSRFLLQNNYIFMLPVNVWPPFITIGILTATFSASLSNLIGSSRVLEALAKDNVYGRLLCFVSAGVYRNNPIVAVFASWALVQVILLIGSLNLIAQINSVLFLLSYLATNLACLGLELASAPNFRPSFKFFTWYTAFFGLVGTLIMMFIINPLYAFSSILLCVLLILLLHLFSPSRSADWGSISQALIFHQVRKYLLMLDSRKDHVKFWRPQILLMVVNPRSSCALIDFVNVLKKSGLYVLGHVKVGPEFADLETDPTLVESSHWLSLVDHLKVKAFIELTVARSVREGMHHLIRISGMGAMKPNTIVLGFYDEEQPKDFFLRAESPYRTNRFQEEFHGGSLFPLRKDASEKQLSGSEYISLISDVLRMKKNVCLCRHFHNLDKFSVAQQGRYRFIDVWPVNFFNPNSEDPFDTSSLFMLQLACIIQMVQGWKHLKLRVFLCDGRTTHITDLTDFRNQRSNELRFKQQLQQLRISASIHQVADWSRLLASLRGGCVLQTTDDVQVVADNISRAYLLNVNQIMRLQSEQTALTFVYLPPPPQVKISSQYLQCLTELTADLPPTVMVHGVSAVTSTTL
ncbi:solute carrier family 12 member 9 [Macrosteles quadrilineatus]|uniref:solute carrier family 12 member 9 n=1 Tax=Macrosteles quadrilineatus TaxID=74068 RepID=UPI0023E20EC6|nr:solute carrier family 12 member 9 [Macrosteles quadrilineatus]